MYLCEISERGVPGGGVDEEAVEQLVEGLPVELQVSLELLGSGADCKGKNVESVNEAIEFLSDIVTVTIGYCDYLGTIHKV